MTSWAAPFTGGYDRVLGTGEVFTILNDPPETARAKHQDRSQALIDVMAELEREIAVYDLAGDDVALAFFLAQRDSITE
jgi:hypothetical protein